jgi:uncharacterized protein YacL
MLDFVIILLFILAAAGIGFDAVELLPPSVQAQVSNVEALRWVTAGFGALIGFAVGLMAQVTYRRFQAQVRKMPIEVLLTRAVGLVLGTTHRQLDAGTHFLDTAPLGFWFY